MSDRPELDKEGLIKDRKIKNGEDNRTYKVSFQKIKSVMPQFECKWNVEEGIRDMISKLIDLGFTNKIFKTRHFYRLQQLEDLFSKGYLNEHLLWKDNKED